MRTAGPAAADRGAVTLGKNLPGGWCMVQARTGVSAAGDVCRPFATIPDDLDGSILLQPRHEQRHSTLLASGRVWKTHVPSTAGADQVTISYGSDPAHELAWNWRTEPGALKTAIRILPARFESAENDARQDPDLTGMRIVSGTSTLVRSPSLLNDPVIRRHVATVSDPRAPTRPISIRCPNGSDQGWGPWRTAKTGRCKPGRIEFLYIGDAQTGLQDWGRRHYTGIILYRVRGAFQFLNCSRSPAPAAGNRRFLNRLLEMSTLSNQHLQLIESELPKRVSIQEELCRLLLRHQPPREPTQQW